MASVNVPSPASTVRFRMADAAWRAYPAPVQAKPVDAALCDDAKNPSPEAPKFGSPEGETLGPPEA